MDKTVLTSHLKSQLQKYKNISNHLWGQEIVLGNQLINQTLYLIKTQKDLSILLSSWLLMQVQNLTIILLSAIKAIQDWAREVVAPKWAGSPKKGKARLANNHMIQIWPILPHSKFLMNLLWSLLFYFPKLQFSNEHI